LHVVGLLFTSNMRFGSYNARVTTVARQLDRYKLYLVGVQEIRWAKGSPVRAQDDTFVYGKGNENHRL